MYNDIADIYLEIFPLNQAFMGFLPDYLGDTGSAVLDLGCGPGDYVDTLSRDGYMVVGIDSSQGMIAKAQSHKRGTFHNFSFVEISQLAGNPYGGFDCVYCIGNSLSYLPKEAMKPFLKDVYNLLNASGHFILQVVNWDKQGQVRSSDFPINTISGGRTFHRQYDWIDRSKVIFHTEIQKDGETLMSWEDPLFPKYLTDVLAELQTTGFTVTGQFGDYQKSPFDTNSSPAMILVAQKE